MDVKRKMFPSGDDSLWIGVVKLVLILVMAALLYLLGESMVHHHFFSGGALNYHNDPTGP